MYHRTAGSPEFGGLGDSADSPCGAMAIVINGFSGFDIHQRGTMDSMETNTMPCNALKDISIR